MAELQWRGKMLAQSMRENGKDAQALLRTDETHSALDPAMLAADPTWHNRLIQGERLDVLTALLPEFAGLVNLIYIDPPFMTGRDFKQGGLLAYSDKWRGDLDAYLQWLA